jgi:type III pantothenate kinase
MFNHPLVAVDIGNARIKLGLFADECAEAIPEPLRTLPLLGNEPELDAITPWLSDIHKTRGSHWHIASVNRPAASRLIDWLAEHRPEDRVTLLAAGDLPLEVRLERPDMVGIDRLVDAVAVNQLRDASRPAVIVDIGSAITVDLVSADGAFLGGAILPGIQMSARAMHHFTDLLPLVKTSELNVPPPAVGISTESAMKAGLFWGAVGAIRELIGQQCKGASGGRSFCEAASGRRSQSQVFLTGGAGAAVAELLCPETCYLPNLTLAGIAIAAKNLESATGNRDN